MCREQAPGSHGPVPLRLSPRFTALYQFAHHTPPCKNVGSRRHRRVHLSGPVFGTRTPWGGMPAEGGLCSRLWSLPGSSNPAPHCASVCRGSAGTFPGGSDKLPSSKGTADNRSQIYSKSHTTQVPTAQTNDSAGVWGSFLDFTKQSEQLGCGECAAPGTSHGARGPGSGRTKPRAGQAPGQAPGRTP